MALTSSPLIGAGLPQLIITTDGSTSLIQYAAAYMQDALQAWRIADANAGIDWWPPAGISLKIPQAAPNNGGVPYT